MNADLVLALYCERMTNAALFSGGKDSTLAIHKAIEKGIRIDLLITMRPKRSDSYMFHYPNTKYTVMQADALGIRHVFAETSGEKEIELGDLEKVLVENEVKLLVTGATYSRYQGDRINNMANGLGIEHMAPLWQIDPLEELNELAERFDAIITSVSAEGFDRSMLGARIDRSMIEKLKELNRKYRINMLFEGGEAESFVLDAPLFSKRIQINKARVEFKNDSGTYIIEDAEMVER